MEQLIGDYGRDRTLLLSTGNAFNRSGEVEQRRAALILQGYNMMDYDVFALGPYDAVYGLPTLVKMAKDKSFQLVCSNLATNFNGAIYPYALIDKGGEKILVTSIIDPRLATVKKGIDLALVDPIQKLNHLFATIPHDLSVLVVHTTEPRLNDLLNKLQVQPDVVILGYQSGVFSPTTLSGGAIRVANNNSGKTLCAVDLSKNGATWQVTAWQHKTLRMDSIVPEPSLDKMIIQQEKWEEDYLRQQHKKKVTNAQQENFYLGADWCARCHSEIAEKWSQSRHAHAIDILKQQGHQEDLRCLPCHVTGMSIGELQQQPAPMGGGFISLEKTPYLANVQCESCHGPGKQHALQPQKYSMPRADGKTCLRCHTPETNPGFIYSDELAH